MPKKEPCTALLHQLYVRQDWDECLELIEEQLEANGPTEYPIYLKANIKRQQGEIQESLVLFQQATALNPYNKANLVQVARSLFLLGKHQAAIDVYDEAIRVNGAPDWESVHNKGLCYMYMKDHNSALATFQEALSIQKHDATYLQMGKLYTQMEDYQGAINVCLEAIEFSPENPEILTTLGLLYLRQGDNHRAFDFLGNSLTHDPRNAKTILAAGSIIQDHNDMDVALVKYRVAAVATPNSPQLWNNIGMCFFGKQRYIASIACLKKALYLGPFEWIVSYNLGLVHLNTGQYASAFHFLSASVNLKSDFPHSYMYLAVTLAKLDDFQNACSAYEKAIQMESDHLFHLNYAITLYNNDEEQASRQQFQLFSQLFNELDAEAKNMDPEVMEQQRLLGDALQMGNGTS